MRETLTIAHSQSGNLKSGLSFFAILYRTYIAPIKGPTTMQKTAIGSITYFTISFSIGSFFLSLD